MKTALILAGYIVLVNLTGFFLMGDDKFRARRHAFRIPEASLFAVALIGGSAGAIAGMYTFHHKTKHPRFVIGMPVILALQVVLVLVTLSLTDISFL